MAAPNFPLREARRLARGLFQPDPRIYWADFLGSALLGWGGFALAVAAPAFSPYQLLAGVVATLALYRAVIFTHELSHLRPGHLPGFRVVWNLLCGLPLMVPSFMYRGVHLEHHHPGTYGTGEDGEYLPFAAGRRRAIALYLAQALVLPLLAAARFILLTPLARVSPGFRRLVWQRASSLSIDFNYRRPLEGMDQSNDWRWQEVGACLYGVAAIALVALGILPGSVLVLWYLVMAAILVLNSLRTLAAHRYRHAGDRSLTLPEQFLDSTDIPGRDWITPLWAPVGLRFHATHHLFPGMPYHNLGRMYRRLARDLDDNGAFLAATRTGLWPALGELWRDAGERR